MRSRWLLLFSLPVVFVILFLGFTLWRDGRDSGELDRRIVALPPKTAALPALSNFEVNAPPTRLIELLEEARRRGAGASLGGRGQEMVRREQVLAELERRAPVESPETRRTVISGLREDLDRDPDWSATVRDHRVRWLRWVVRLRAGKKLDETEVLGPPTGIHRALGGRRLSDGDLLRGVRTIERFFDAAEKLSFTREDYAAALDALVENPDPADDPVGAYFAGHVTRDFKFTWRKLRDLRKREERLLKSLE